MCNFAKFLALGLIASEAAALSVEDFKKIVGVKPEEMSKDDTATSTTTYADLRRVEACQKMNDAYRNLTAGDLVNPGLTIKEGQVSACNTGAFASLKLKMQAQWVKDAQTLGLTPDFSTSTVDDDSDKNTKQMLIGSLKERLATIPEFTQFSPSTTHDYYVQIQNLKGLIANARTVQYTKLGGGKTFTVPTQKRTEHIGVVEAAISGVQLDSAWNKATAAAGRAKATAEKALQNNSNPDLRTEAQGIQTEAGAYGTKKKPATKALAERELVDAKKLETDADAVLAAVEKERAEAVGGFFGVFFGLVGLTLAFLMSPCVQFDFNTGKTATNWATGEVDDEWTQMEMYKEAYKTDKTPEQWRNEVFGLPEEQPVDSAKATSSALTLVPVVVLAGGVFAVARRGLNKRRAQKKAKRVSRAQQKLHEDL